MLHLVHLLVLQAIRITWNFAGIYGANFAAIIGAVALFGGTVIAERVFGSQEPLGRKIVVGVVGAILGPTLLLSILFLISFFFYAPDAVLTDATESATSQQRSADHKQWMADTKKLQDDLLTAQQGKPGPGLGIIDPKLTINHREDTAKVVIGLKNFSTSTAIEDIAQSAAVVFGTGKQQQLITLTQAPNMRLNPLQTHHLELGIGPPKNKAPNPFIKLYEKKGPIVFELNLYFTTNGQPYSLREVYAWKYDFGWVIGEEHLFTGSVPLPAGIQNGQPVYWSAPWLPPVACPPTPEPKKG